VNLVILPLGSLFLCSFGSTPPWDSGSWLLWNSSTWNLVFWFGNLHLGTCLFGISLNCLGLWSLTGVWIWYWESHWALQWFGILQPGICFWVPVNTTWATWFQVWPLVLIIRTLELKFLGLIIWNLVINKSGFWNLGIKNLEIILRS